MYDLMLALCTPSDLGIFARNFLSACLGVPGTGLIRYKKEIHGVFLRKRLTSIDLFERPWSVRTRFSPLASALGPEQKLAVSPSSAVRGGQYDTEYDTEYVTFEY